MLKRFSHFSFSTKVWLTSAIITPLFFLLFDPMLPPVSGIWKDPIEIIFTMIIFGGGLSIPNWILLIIATWQLSKKGKNIRQIKNTLTLISVSLTLILFFLLIVFVQFPIMWWAALFYALTVSIGIQFYHLKNVTPEVAWMENILDDHVF
ncbi:MAG: hypothetical protein AB8H03_02170 [Saprospiraceae bacterium]